MRFRERPKAVVVVKKVTPFAEFPACGTTVVASHLETLIFLQAFATMEGGSSKSLPFGFGLRRIPPAATNCRRDELISAGPARMVRWGKHDLFAQLSNNRRCLRRTRRRLKRKRGCQCRSVAINQSGLS